MQNSMLDDPVFLGVRVSRWPIDELRAIPWTMLMFCPVHTQSAIVSRIQGIRIEFSDLPNTYRPLPMAFCPKLELPPTSIYPGVT